ncbi:unnamed protein product, partial [Meganyctiphanes norvegica]
MLDFDVNEDQALMDAVVSKGKIFWVGGQKNEENQWYWADNRPIDMGAPFWYWDEPNEDDNTCAIANITVSGNYKRGHIYDSACSESRNFICQTLCPFEFERIGKNCYFRSEDLGLPHVSWQDARDYCQALDVPAGYYSDLAVLGLPDQDDYDLLYRFHAGYHGCVWLGALAETSCVYKWIDGRSISSSSLYWYTTVPYCGTSTRVYLQHSTAQNRTYLADHRPSVSHAFICQMFAKN